MTEKGSGADRQWRWLALGAVIVVVFVVGASFVRADSGPGDCDSPGGPAGLVALDVATGAKVWERKVADARSFTEAGNTLALVGQSGIALAVDASSGEVLWCNALVVDDEPGGVGLPGFAALDGVVATTLTDRSVVAFDAATGAELWRHPPTGDEGVRLRAENGLFYVIGGAAVEPDWLALEPSSGRKSVDAPAPLPPSSIGIGIGDEVVIDQLDIIATAESGVTAYDLDSGEPRWRVGVVGAPQQAFHLGELVVVPSESRVTAIDFLTGEVVWEVDHGNPGSGGILSFDGGYRSFAIDESGTIVVGLIVAGKRTLIN